jgi:hypothetical protein
MCRPTGCRAPPSWPATPNGGAVISGAATGVPEVIGLVFASAFAPDEGETLGELK